MEGDQARSEQAGLGEGWGQGGPSCLVGVGNEAQELGPGAQKPPPFHSSSQIILEAGQRVSLGPLFPVHEQGAVSLPTNPPWSPSRPEYDSSGGWWEGAWEHQWGLQAAVWFP